MTIIKCIKYFKISNNFILKIIFVRKSFHKLLLITTINTNNILILSFIIFNNLF